VALNFVPNDLQNIVFKRSFNGYNCMQVDDVLLKVVEDLAELIKENARLKENLEDVNSKLQYYKGIEVSLQNSLIIAQKTSDEIISNAKKNAENIKKEAELMSLKAYEEANKKILEVNLKYEQLRSSLEAYKTKIESIIKSQLKTLEYLDAELIKQTLFEESKTFTEKSNEAAEIEKTAV
jgi:cell division initiation protein